MEGREGLGHASILGGRVDPISILMAQSAQRQRNAAAQQQEQVKNRDRVMDYTEKYNPDTKFIQLNQRLGDAVNQELREPTRALLQNGDIQRADMYAKKVQANLESRRKEYDGWKVTFEDASKDIDDNIKTGRFNSEARSKIRNFLYDEKGQLKPDNDIRAGMMQIDNFTNDPRNLNRGWVAGAFMKGLPEKITQHYTDVYNSLGQQYNTQETKTKLGIQTDERGNVIMDERTGQPKISMTDDVLIQALQNPDIASLIKMDIPEATIDQKRQYVSALLEGLDPKEVKNTRSQGFKTNESDRRFTMSFGGSGYSKSEADLKTRDTLLDRAVSGEGKDIIAYFDKPGSNDRVSYAVNPTIDGEKKKGKFIKVEFANTETEVVDGVPKTVKKVIPQYLPINTGEEKRTAKIQLSARMDQIEKKTSVGEDYPRYVNEKRLAEEKKNPKKNIDLRADKRINQGSPLK